MARTENLTIMFTDIVGFTAKTSRQSRNENASMLQEHDRLLLPVVTNYGGRKVKSIGDAMLVSFRSPTDAVRCGMALQDATWEYNRNKDSDAQLRIRVALTLGEVRVEGGDIFGEPVNIASRVEGLTPAGEVYLAESVYLAMNKAEAPTEAVGTKELKGIPEAVKIYRVPQHQTLRLVASGDAHEAFPFGGLHRMKSDASNVLERSMHLLKTTGRKIAQTPLWGMWLGGIRTHCAQYGAFLTTWPRTAYAHTNRKLRIAGLATLGFLSVGIGVWGLNTHAALAHAEHDMATGNWERVEAYAKSLLLEDHDNPEAKVLLGHVAFSKKNRVAALNLYEEALVVDDGLRDEPTLLSNSVESLGWAGKKAQALLKSYPSSSAVLALQVRLGEPGYWGRKRAVETLEMLNEEEEIDRVTVAIQDLIDAPDCSKRREAVVVLGQEHAHRALPALRKAAADTQFFSGNSCLKQDAQKAIHQIESA